MDVDDIPDQFEQLVDRARAALNREIEKAQKLVDNLTVEKTAAAKALAELKDQHGKAKAELETTLADLDRASSLRGLNSALAKARMELERLNSETAKETKALEVLVKKRTEVEARVVALEDNARAATAERCRAQEMLEQVKIKLRSVG